MVEEILNREDRRSCSLSQGELERRWKAVRERMAAKNISHLVVQSQQRFVGGYFRWFTDFAGQNYHITAVFPVDEDMTIIGHGAPAPAKPATPPEWALRGVKERINTPAFPNVWWEDAWDADKAVEVIKRNKPGTVGLVGLGNMSAALYENVKKGLQGVNVVNATDLVDEVRMVKSEEEIKLHRAAAYMHEMSYEVAKKAIKPGRTVSEIIEEIRHAQVLAGSEEQQVNITFGRPGVTHYSQTSWGNTVVRRPFREGDVINMLIESSAAGGYWYDLRRFVCIGKAPAAVEEAYALVKEARKILAANLKPGVVPGVALKASDEFLKSKGCPPEERVAGHGQGLDLVERPVVRYEETAMLEPGMVISLHPTAKTKHASACIADTYVIGNSGAVPLYANLLEDDELAVVT
ncbi:MAG: M24 family metallopeptidase [Betaproteobacteria bacterium]|nr:M24 family metallopeptidase [Betaproteobacteria bacterium]